MANRRMTTREMAKFLVSGNALVVAKFAFDHLIRAEGETATNAMFELDEAMDRLDGIINAHLLKFLPGAIKELQVADAAGVRAIASGSLLAQLRGIGADVANEFLAGR